MNVSPATKAAAISDYLAGKGGYFQIALEYGINPYTLKKMGRITRESLKSILSKRYNRIRKFKE